jgi:hypothetical protein
MRTKALKFPVLCEPELEEVINHLNRAERRDMAKTLERWIAQLNFSADFMDYHGTGVDEDIPRLDDGLVELAARLEKQAADIRATLAVPRKTKRDRNVVAFTGN